MHHNQPNAKELIKFFAPKSLKDSMNQLSNERNISLSALLRIITTEYVRRNLSE